MAIFSDKKPVSQGPSAAPAGGEAAQAAPVQTVVGRGVTLEGTLSGEGEVTVAGTLKGQVNLSGCLTVSAKGLVEAEVKARRVVVEGTIKGNVAASERVELRASGVVEGDISTPRVSVAEGATLRGRVSMTGEASSGGALRAAASKA